MPLSNKGGYNQWRQNGHTDTCHYSPDKDIALHI
jgi:hypothetical protein